MSDAPAKKGSGEISAHLRDFAENIAARSEIITTLASSLNDLTNKALVLTKVRTGLATFLLCDWSLSSSDRPSS